jgi:hypothetical protein
VLFRSGKETDGSTPSSGKSSATSVATEVAVAAEKWLKGQRSN